MPRMKKGAYGVLELAKEVLSSNGNKALTAPEIWEKATEGQKQKLSTKAQDPAQNIYMSIYQNIKTHEDSCFIGVGRNPVRWQIKTSDKSESLDEVDESDDSDENIDTELNISNDKQTGFKERALHKILVSYVGCDPYFSTCYCKTVFHERSEHGKRGMNHWVHPDVVGVSYPFGDTGSYSKKTLGFMTKLEHTECRLYSFEVKIGIKVSDLRGWFFEAVSNSSWAHEGYLVALHYEPGLEDEMRMLNESFGIGFIQLNAEDYTKSVRLFSAKRKEGLDWNMINRLLTQNPDFRQFVEIIESDLASSSVRNKKDFDEQFTDFEDFKTYIIQNNIK